MSGHQNQDVSYQVLCHQHYCRDIFMCILEIRVHNKHLPILTIYLVRIQVRSTIFRNCQRQIALTLCNWKSGCNKKKKNTQFGHKSTTIQTGNYFTFKLLIIIFMFKISILFYKNKTFGENNL